MKVWVLFFFAAVWMQMPSEGTAKHHAPTLRAAHRAVKALSPAMLTEISKRHNAEVKKRGASSEEDDGSVREFLESDEVSSILAMHGVTLKEIDDLVDNDDEIDAEDKDLMKAILVMTLAGFDVTSPEFWADLEDRAIFKKK